MKRLRERFRVSAWLAPRAYWWLAICAVLLAAGGVLEPLAWLGALALAAFAIMLVLDAFWGPRRAELEIEREPGEPFLLRRSGVLRYCIRNRGSQVVRVGIAEAPSPLLREEGDEICALIAPQAQTELERAVTPVARGSQSLETLYVWYENAAGLLRRRMRLTRPQEIRVYPDLSAVERYGSLHVRNRLVEAGLRRMRLRGTGTEPESVREWSSGDSFRSINWKATARRGRVMVAQYEVERSQNVIVLLDAGRLMTPRVDEQRKFDYAVTAALSVASIASLANDKVGVIAFASEILRAYAPRASGRSLRRIVEEIHDVEPRFEESDYASAFAYVRSHVQKRSLVMLFTDMVDPVAQSSVLAEIGLLAKRHLVICAFMNDAAVENAIEREPRTASDVYALGVALELRKERQTAAAVLERLGVRVVDVPARELTTALIEQYLRIKQRGLL